MALCLDLSLKCEYLGEAHKVTEGYFVAFIDACALCENVSAGR